jgi:phosphatidylglycerol:prolipoprotein diacylglycerol transferase
MPWTGLSSFGGFVGALVGVLAWKYFILDDRGWPHRRIRPVPILPYADLVLSVFPIGWMFGRAGCSSVHDHLGAKATADTLLAVARPLTANDGPITHIGFIEFFHGHDPRFDLGLLELLFTVVLAACFALTWHKRVLVGSYVIVASLAYAPVRFAMDFLRLPDADGGDTRYAGLTPAQYGCVLLFLYGLGMIPYVRSLRARRGDPPGPGATSEAGGVGALGAAVSR